MNDKQIIGLFLRRDEQALRETDEKYGRLCRRVAYGILQNEQDTEECLDTAYIKLWNSIPPKEPELLKGFLCAIVRNTALDMRKVSWLGSLECYDELAGVTQSSGSVESELESRELGKLIKSFLAKQNKVNGSIFVARYYFGMSYETISDEIGIKENAVRTRLTRLRKELRAFLEERGFDV